MHRKAHTTTIYTNIRNTERSGDNSIKLKIGLNKAHQLRITEYPISNLNQKEQNTMKVIIVKPFTNPYTKEIKGDLESMQAIIGG